MGRFLFPLCTIKLFFLAQFSSICWSIPFRPGVMFDCTQAINRLLQNETDDTQDENSSALLKQALNESRSIYYQVNGTLEETFPDRIIQMIVQLEELDWKLGMVGQDGLESSLILSFDINQNQTYFQKTYHTQDDYQHDDIMRPIIKVLESSLNRTSFPIHIVLSWSSGGPCEDKEKNVRVEMLRYGAYEAGLVPGIEYNEFQIDCWKISDYEMRAVPLQIISVEFVAGQRIPESYGLFREFMNELTTKNLELLSKRRVNLQNMVFRLVLLQRPRSIGGGGSSSDGLELELEQVYKGYAAMLARLANEWAHSPDGGGHPVIIELSEVTLSNYKERVAAMVPTMRNTVQPTFYFNTDAEINRKLMDVSLLLASSKLFSTFQVTFFNTYSPHDFQSHFSAFSANLRIARSRSTCCSPEPSVILNVDTHRDEVIRSLMITYQNQSTRDTIPLKAITVTHIYNLELLSELQALPQTAACSTRIAEWQVNGIRANSSALVELLLEKCSPERERELIILLDLHVLLGYGYLEEDASHYYMLHLQQDLALVASGVQEFRQEFPAVEVILRMPRNLIFHDEDEYFPGGLFCDEKEQKRNEYLEAFVNWAFIHNFSISLRGVMSSNQDAGWLYRLGGSVNGKYDSVLLARNYPSTMGYLDRSPCLPLYKQVPRERVPMFGNGMGAVLHVTVYSGEENKTRLLAPKEFETQLRFALEKFSKIGIIGGELSWLGSRLEATLPLLSPPSQSRIFIELPLERVLSELDQFRAQIGKLSNLAHKLKESNSTTNISIQISDWEHQQHHSTHVLLQLEELLKFCKTSNLSLGIVLQNCTKGRWFEEDVLESPILLLGFSHLLCVEPWNVTYDNDDQYPYSGSSYFSRPVNYFYSMWYWLDEKFATKTVLSRVLPAAAGTEIHFRFQIQSSTTTEEYFKMVRDVSLHAELYNMSYFPIKAFQLEKHQQETKNSNTTSATTTTGWERGWWRLADNNVTTSADTGGLSNPLSYIELESEFLGQETKRPPLILDSEENSRSSGSNWVAIGLSASLATSILSLVGYALWREWERNKYLSRLEELDFLNGTSAQGNGEDPDAENHYLNMKFDRQFEIPRVNLESDGNSRIIGAGNFGTVYKALVKDKWVALKVPKEGCSRELFKSTLQEIKILCYVGSHENLVQFVGAYIKQIGSGIVQIATELCENGTLMAHLRKLGPSIITTGDQKTEAQLVEIVNSWDLGKFCLEIASGMEYLTSKRVIHGDLATRNVLLAEFNVCKVADFGLSRKLYGMDQYVKQSQEPLPWRWVAPEGLSRMEFSSKSDVWSYGVTIWEIYSLGCTPYPGLSWSTSFVEELDAGLRMEQPTYASREIFDRMATCWNLQPESRPSFSELCDFFRNLRHSDYATVVMTQSGSDND